MSPTGLWSVGDEYFPEKPICVKPFAARAFSVFLDWVGPPRPFCATAPGCFLRFARKLPFEPKVRVSTSKTKMYLIWKEDDSGNIHRQESQN